MKYACSECGELEYVRFDGYPFGDRQLEGVYFKASFDDNDGIQIEGEDDWDIDPHCITLSQEHWFEEAAEYAEETDVLECPHCHNDVDNPLL